MERRTFLKSAAAIGAAAGAMTILGLRAAQAQPAKIPRLRIVAPGSVGGGYDGQARGCERVLRAAGLIDSAQITNPAGAGGTVGLVKFVEEFRGQGDAWLVSGSTMVSSIIANKTPIDLSATTPLARLFGTFNAIVVPANSPYKSLEELVAAFKADPGAISWAGGSIGGGDHMIAGMFAAAVGVDPKKLNYVPFTGGGEILAALLGGHVTMGSSGWSEFAEQIASGQVRCLGITADKAIPGISVPTLQSQGVAVTFYSWGSLLAPPDISAEARANHLAIIDAMVKRDEWKQESAKNGWIDLYLPGDAFVSFINEQSKTFRTTLVSLGLA